MRLFLTVCSLAAVAYAKPQYNYGTGVSGTNGGQTGGLSGHFSTSGSSGSSFLAAPSFGGASFGGSSGSNGAGFSSGIGGGFGGGFGGGSSGNIGGGFNGGFGGSSGGSQSEGSAGFEAPHVHKQFFSIAAPEDNDNLEQSKHLVIGRPQKNYRVVFIKAPSSSNANVKLSAEYAPQEEKTAIYVLTKKDSILEVNDIATPAPTQPSKPEVFFIKYKTEQEAQHAQKTIEAEYDKIQGTSEHSDGGVGQVQSVVGSLDGGASAGVGAGAGVSSGSSSFGVGGGPSSFGGSSSGFNSGSGSSGFGIGGSSSGASSPTYLPPGK